MYKIYTRNFNIQNPSAIGSMPKNPDIYQYIP
jgi:hypothetical protein